MLSVQKIVNDYFQKSPLYLELLSKNLLNTSQLADNLIPVITEQTLKTPSRNTVVVAINRIKRKLDLNTESFVKDVKITANYPVFWHYLKFKNYTSLTDFLGNVSISKDDLLLIKNNKIVVVAKTREKQLHDKNNQKYFIESDFRDNLCELKIEFPRHYISQSGLLYKITSLLFWNQRPIVDISMLRNKVYIYALEKDFTAILSLLRKNFN